MAESENQTQQPEEETEESINYKAPAKVSLDELKEKDKEDESLEKYKKALLGDAKENVDPPFPDDDRNVILHQMALVVPDREDVILDLKGDPKNFKHIIIKEGSNYKVRVTFYVQREIVSGLRYFQKVYRKGIKVDKNSFMVGSYGPSKEAHIYHTPVEEAPSGMMSRGSYTVKSLFTDDDKNKILDWEWKFDIKKDWN